MKAPGIALVLAGKPKGKPAEPDEDDEGPSEEEVAAFAELQKAMKGGDAATGALALKNFMKECGAY